MTDSLRFYCYAHVRKDTGEVFYIGKGALARSADSRQRSSHWKNVVAKAGGFTILRSRPMTEADAFAREIRMIAKGREAGGPLVNKTDGGEGASGHKHSDEARGKMSAALTGKTKTDAQRRAMSLSRKGRPLATEHAACVAARNAARVWTPGMRQRLSDAGKGRLASTLTLAKRSVALSRPVSTACGLVFSSGRLAVAWLRSNGRPTASAGNISSCLTGRLSQAYGYVWQRGNRP
jgi:NUMOD3 motif